MKKIKWISNTLFIIGTVFLLYYVYLSLRYGFHYIVFSWVFLLMGGCLLAVAFLEKKYQRLLISYLPSALRYIFLVLVSLALCFFCYVEAKLIMSGLQASSTQADTLIVLGAQLNGSDVSRLLRYRLDAALQFHQDYPNAMIIVSGGQGPGEDVSEAQAMKDYLVARGIQEEQIIMEDQSKNTAENFEFSKRLLKNDTHVSVISNDFHMYRGAYLCEESGLTCSLYPARSDVDLAPNFYLREFFGVVKDEYLTKLK